MFIDDTRNKKELIMEGNDMATLKGWVGPTFSEAELLIDATTMD